MTAAPQTALGNTLAYGWTVYDNALPSASDDTVDLTLTIAGDSYAALGFASSGMAGDIILCYFNVATATPDCSWYAGTNYDVSRRDPVLVVSSVRVPGTRRMGAATNFTVRFLASRAGITAGASRRIILAKGGFSVGARRASQHSAGDRVSANANVYAGTSSAITQTVQGRATAIAIIVIALVLGTIIGAVAACTDTALPPVATNAVRGLVFLLMLIALALYALLAQSDLSQNKRPQQWQRVFAALTVLTLALTLLTAGKRISIANAIGSSYERVLPYHITLGLLMTIFATVHFAGFANTFRNGSDVFAVNSSQYNHAPLFGFLAWLFTVILVLGGLVRRFAYRLFRVLHCLFVLTALFTILHAPTAGLLLVVPLVLYVADLMFRLIQYCRMSGQVTVGTYHEAAGVTELRVQLPASQVDGPDAAQFALLSLSSHGGPVAQPFTVAWYTPTAEAVFFIKNVGGWTGQLAETARSGVLANATAHLTGYLGRLQVPLAASPNLLLVAGGIGITPITSTLRMLPANPTVTRVIVAWSVREPALLDVLAPVFAEIKAASAFVEVIVYMTKGDGKATAPFATSIESGRPDVAALLQKNFAEGERVSVFSCGPAALMEAAEAAAGRRKNTLIHSETFEL